MLKKIKNIVNFNLADEEENNCELVSSVLKLFEKVGLLIPEITITDVFRLGKNKGK